MTLWPALRFWLRCLLCWHHLHGVHAEIGERLAQTYLVKNQGCFGCSIACGRVTKIEGRGSLDGLGEGPEYEAGWSYGAACGVTDLGAIVKCNFICNEQGMDPISLGSTVACASVSDAAIG